MKLPTPVYVRSSTCKSAETIRASVKRKTDRDDALKLAKMALDGELPAVHVPGPQRRQKRRLILHRRALVARRTACKNAIRSTFSQQGRSHELPRGTKAWTKAGAEQGATSVTVRN